MKQNLKDINTVLLDIEGTICPISFVKETLFPYAINVLPEVLRQKWDDPEFAKYRDAFPDDAKTSPEAFEAHVKDLTKKDVKIAYLKDLQGYLWQSGYESGAYSTPLFPDVLPALEHWHSQTQQPTPLSINIYSSGSVFAQKLLFGHIHSTPTSTPSSTSNSSTTINAQHLITAWFDTTNAGPKTSKDSYTHIADTLSTSPSKILFLSDNTAEIEAALEAGMKAVVVDRMGNAELSEEERRKFDVVLGFDQVSECLR